MVSDLISVIIPAFNRKELLRHTLDNVLRQSARNFEVIVVDDHSTDGMPELVRQTFGDAVRLITNRGKGPGAARNTGLGQARGSLIKFFDSDDLMTSNMLAVQSARLSESDKGFVYSPYFYAEKQANGSWFVKDDIVLNYYPLPSARPLWHYMMVDGLFITIPGMMFKREFLDRVGPWREDVVAYEDWDYLFRISLLEPHPLHAPECAFLYHVHGNQTTEKSFTDRDRDLDKVKVLKDLQKRYIDGVEGFSILEKEMFQNKFFQVGRKTTSDHPLFAELHKHNSVLQKIMWALWRVRQKAGRMRTGTDWQPCHGPLVSGAQTAAYLQNL